MLKKLLLVLLSIFLISFTFSAQEEDFDDFDSVFEDAEDFIEPVEEKSEKPQLIPMQVVASAFSSIVHFSGDFNGEAGVAYIRTNEDLVSGVLSIKNTLNMAVTPAPVFSLRASLYTGYDNGFSIELKSFYFDYFLLNKLFISAGKKTLTWGYPRIFCNSTYYGCDVHSNCLYSTGPLLTNIFAEDTAPISFEIRYPWTTGTITFVATGQFNQKIQPDAFSYYASIELSLLNTSLNFFEKRPAKISSSDSNKNDLIGFEIKRTILGFDTYAQGIYRVRDYSKIDSIDGCDYVVATAGFYRLFDSFDPNIGINIEYQYEFDPKSENMHNHRIAFEGGLKRIGKHKNMKLGLMSHYSFTDMHGFTALNFLVSGLIPYADWSTKAAVGYGKKYSNPVFMVSTGLSLALTY